MRNSISISFSYATGIDVALFNAKFDLQGIAAETMLPPARLRKFPQNASVFWFAFGTRFTTVGMLTAWLAHEFSVLCTYEKKVML